MSGDRGLEGVDDDWSGDGSVGGDGECVAGVVVEPGEDFDVGADAGTEACPVAVFIDIVLLGYGY